MAALRAYSALPATTSRGYWTITWPKQRANRDHGEVTQRAVEEHGARRDQRFLSLFHDPQEGCLLFASPGRRAPR